MPEENGNFQLMETIIQMSNSLVPILIQIGGVGAIIVVAGLLTAKWLLKKLDASLNAYVTAFSTTQAAIDARLINLERIVEEQSRLTKAIETIKDEMAAQAKRRDNRWSF